MSLLYAYSLIPILSVSVLLLTSILLYGRQMRGLAAYCGAIAAWSGALLLAALPADVLSGPSAGSIPAGGILASGVPLVDRLVQVGAFVPAAFLHAAYDTSTQKRYQLVWLGYGAAALVTFGGVLWPGILYRPGTLEMGPLFWPSIGLAIVAGSLPLPGLLRSYRAAPPLLRRRLHVLAVSGTVGFCGALSNVLLLTRGIAVPYPMILVLGSLLILTGMLGGIEQAAGRRLLERSLLYAALTALLTAGFLFGVLTVVSKAAQPLLTHYRLGALFLLFLAALAFEPLRRHLQQSLGRRLLRSHARGEDLAVALAAQESRADQADRLAVLGSFVSAVSHEIRNPLGVISANVRLMELEGCDEELCTAIRDQVTRASRFVDDLLRYGRPRPLTLEVFDLAETIRLAQSTAGAALPSGVVWAGLEALPSMRVEGDSSQLLQVFVVLFENAILSLTAVDESTSKVGGPTSKVRVPTCGVEAREKDSSVIVRVEDNGPGIPETIRSRLFEPFVSGRKRDGHSAGTGLGLAIARSIVERHHGHLELDDSSLGGACFRVEIPLVQKVLADT